VREGLEFSHFGVPIGAGAGTLTLYHLRGIPPAPEPKIIFFPPFLSALLTINIIPKQSQRKQGTFSVHNFFTFKSRGFYGREICIFKGNCYIFRS
jgi:hypothetical protein